MKKTFMKSLNNEKCLSIQMTIVHQPINAHSVMIEPYNKSNNEKHNQIRNAGRRDYSQTNSWWISFS